MTVRPYILHSRSSLSLLGQRVREELSEWGRAWLPEAVTVGAVDVRPLSELRPGDRPGVRIEADPARWCFWPAEGDEASALGDALLGTSPVGESRPGPGEPRTSAGTLVGDVVIASLVDLTCRLADSPPAAGGCRVTGRELPGDAWAPGGGAVELRARLGRVDLVAVLSPDVVSALSPRKTEGAVVAVPSSRREALTRQRARLRAVLDVSELPLDALMAMEIGDVIRLEEPLDTPLELKCEGATLGCAAYLGRIRGHRAVRVAAEQE